MKRCVFLVLSAALFISACSNSSDNGPAFTTDDLQAILASKLQEYSTGKPNFPGGLAMQIITPKGEYFISTGMGSDMSDGYHFRVASCTKTFTASAIMLLYQQGRLNINDLITANIPGTNTPYVQADPGYDIPYKDEITIKMLLMHRAGIFDLTNTKVPEEVSEPYAGQNYCDWVLESDLNHQFSTDEFAGVDAKDSLSYFEPGSSYHYSNTGYSILGKIIERVSGESYQDYITNKLISPNDLSGTSVPVDALDNTLPAPYAEGYIYDGASTTNVTVSNMSMNIAEGNIISTPRDLANWCNRLMHIEAGLRSDIVEMMTNGLPADSGYYGLGIAYSDTTGYGHSGAHRGYLTNMYYLPDKEITYVMFTNTWDLSSGTSTIYAQLSMMQQAADAIIARMGY
jgi:D-alanyl-D-alanine carboxypeptidase